MTEQKPEQKKKAGGIRQYATLGRGKTPQRLGVQTSETDKSDTLERQGVQESERSKTSEVEMLKRSNVQESERLEAVEETSKRSGVKASKRERHTIYFPPELSEWVKIRAIRDKREISELVTEAVERYRSEID